MTRTPALAILRARDNEGDDIVLGRTKKRVALVMLLTGAVIGLAWLFFEVPTMTSGKSRELNAAHRQAMALFDQGKFAEAEPFLMQALDQAGRELGLEHPEYATLLASLAVLNYSQGRYNDSERHFRQVLAIREKVLDPGHPQIADTLDKLGALYSAQGRLDDADRHYARALAMRERALGSAHPDVAQSLNNLATLQGKRGQYDAALALHERALAMRESALGSAHPDVAQSLNNLAMLQGQRGRYDRAEPLFKRALAIEEGTLDPDHPRLAATLNNLAELFRRQGRYDEAAAHLKRALVIREKALGPDHPLLALSLGNLALLYVDRNIGEAESLFNRALAIKEKALGPDHPDVAITLNNLSELFRRQGRYDEAESHLTRALAIQEKALGPDHPGLAVMLSNLALLRDAQGKDEVEPLLRRALALQEKALGHDHPDVATTLMNLAQRHVARKESGPALEHFRRASGIHRTRAIRNSASQTRGGLSEQRSIRDVFLWHLVATLWRQADDPAARDGLVREGFEAGQLANATSAATAIARMAARLATGDDALARMIRERQDAVERWRRIDAALVKAVGLLTAERNLADEQAMRRDLLALDDRIRDIDGRLAASFPQFADLSSPAPLSLAGVQALLAEDEALLSFLVWETRTFIFVVRRDNAGVLAAGVGAEALRDAVANLRQGLNLSDVRSLSDLRPFNRTNAYELYRTLFRPVEPLLDGVRHIFVVPDGPLQSLPVGVLVTEEPVGEVRDFAGYRAVPWLARKYATTVLPSVASLRALRTFARRAAASKPFLGIGDPVLKGDPGAGRGAVPLAALFTARGVADVRSVRNLAALPDTADELRALAKTLGADDDAVMLGAGATERWIKSASLADRKVIAFATHGLVSGELEGLAEPALVLTPPTEGTALDDGLLTASEVALLKLDADWVILSACNTASGDGTPGAEGLSGLARAFFYAGTRSLLVSHWPVASSAAVRITTRMLEEAARPDVARAEALRRAMLSLLAEDQPAHFAHPAFWAPFVVVGEGGLDRR